MRRFASGGVWDVMLPFPDREQHWGCFTGRTYLTDSICLLRLFEATVSDIPTAESSLFSRAAAREKVDVALRFPQSAWHCLPDTVPLSQDAAGTGYLLVELLGRSVQLAYFIWLTDTFGGACGMPDVAVLNDDPGSPLYFRFARGHAVLMPVVTSKGE